MELLKTPFFHIIKSFYTFELIKFNWAEKNLFRIFIIFKYAL